MRLACLVFSAVLAVLALTTAEVSARPLVVVELFTSEGCSSCPPADAFLTELARQRRDVLPLAYHVTYWNSLGWRDPFSLDSATGRQYGYSRHFGANSVFTPQMVVDGARSLVGSDRGNAETAIADAKLRPFSTNMEVKRSAGSLRISIAAGKGQGHLLLVGFDPSHQTTVGRGENAGRRLLESNIVRSMQKVGEWTGEALALNVALPAGEEAAVLIEDESGTILGAARS